jgi:ribosomal protein S27AE
MRTKDSIYSKKKLEQIIKHIAHQPTGKVRESIIDLKTEQKTCELLSLAERYRKCPECGREFFTDHLNREYCTKQHRWNFNNRLNRIDEKTDKTQKSQVRRSLENKDAECFENQRDNNKSILDALVVNDSVIIAIDALVKSDYAPSIYDEKFEINGSPGCFAIRIGDYYICMLNRKEVLIKKIYTHENY